MYNSPNIFDRIDQNHGNGNLDVHTIKSTHEQRNEKKGNRVR